MRIAIIGAGPAGLICAWQLANQKHDVCVFEKKTDLGAQGSGVVIQPSGLQVLDILGILNEVEVLGHRMNYLRGYTDCTHRQKIIAANYGLLRGRFNYSLGINRLALWSILFDRVQTLNVSIETGVCISNVIYSSDNKVDKIKISDGSSNTYGDFDLIIDASGASSKLRRYANRPSNSQMLQYGSLYANLELPDNSPFNCDALTVYSGNDNQGVGIIPTGFSKRKNTNTVSMFFNVDLKRASGLNKIKGKQHWKQESFQNWKKNMVVKWPIIEPLINQLADSKQLYLAKFTHCTLSKPCGKRIVFIGDAAHCSSPQLGQGINMSLIDSLELTQTLNSSNEIDAAIAAYAKKRKLHVWIYQTLAKFLTPFYQSDFRPAILMRNTIFGFFTKIFIFRHLSTYLLSGRIGLRLKRFEK